MNVLTFSTENDLGKFYFGMWKKARIMRRDGEHEYDWLPHLVQSAVPKEIFLKLYYKGLKQKEFICIEELQDEEKRLLINSVKMCNLKGEDLKNACRISYYLKLIDEN